MEQTITELALYATAIIGAASLIVQAAEKISRITPSTKDDMYVGKAKRVVGWLVALLDKLAFNPKR